MEDSREKLRLRFQAETDVDIDPYPEDWKQYAEWLEKLSVKELNEKMVQENEMMRIKIQNAMRILDKALLGIYPKGQ